MTEIKVPSTFQLPARPLSGARAEAIRNAQRAFFEAAMGGTAAPAKSTAPTSQANAPSEPQRYPRPGSRLDIKV